MSILPSERLTLPTLPPELLNTVVDAIHDRKDLLSLAMVCSILRDVIIPGHIQYRVLVASEDHIGLWACLALREQLARNVRVLVLFDRLEVERRTNWGDPVRPRLPSWMDTDRGSAYLSELRDTESLPKDQGNLIGRIALTRALRAMTRLQSVNINATSGLSHEEVQGKLDLISLVFEAVSGTGTMRVVCSEWNDPSLGPDPYPATATHPIFSSTWLRALEMCGMTLDSGLWASFCAMLSRSPGLEVLGVPAFCDSMQLAVPPGSLPVLPCLERLDVAQNMQSQGVQIALFSFLARKDHSLRELRWACSPPLDGPTPYIPSLCTLWDCSTPFVLHLLSKLQPRSLRLRNLGPLAFTSSNASTLLAALSALDPYTLRTIHFSALDSPETLNALSQLFPLIESLTMPCWTNSDADSHVLSRAASTVWNLLSGTPSLNIHRPSVAALLALFPRLHTVRFVDTGDNVLNKVSCLDEETAVSPPATSIETVIALRKRYPELKSVNGWKIKK